MDREPLRCQDGGLSLAMQLTGSRLVVTLAGRLDLDAVEDLAACADQICRGAVRAVVFDVAALTAVDEAGARTLAAACRCLCAHGVTAWVRAVDGELRAMLDRLRLALPERSARSGYKGGDARRVAVPAQPSADLVDLAVTLQRPAGGLAVGWTGGTDGGHDRVELGDLLGGDPVEQ